MCVPVSRFRQHMDYLASNGYNVVSLNDILDHQTGKVKLPHKSIAITFDDAYEDNYKNAYPVLKERGFTAAIFAVAGLVGGTNKWDEEHGWPVARLMDWKQIIEMSENGITFGSHGMTHIPLKKPKLMPRLYKEIKVSKDVIESKLRKPVDFFCYPFGKHNKFAEILVWASGYKGACVVDKEPGKNKEYAGPYNLRRVEINTQNSDIAAFAKLVEEVTRPKLNIMQVCTHHAWGGQEFYSVGLADKLRALGHNVVFVLRKGVLIEDQVKESGLKVEYLRIRASFDLRAIFKLVRLIIKHKTDILHAHTAKEFYPAVLAAKLTGTKVIITRHLLTPLGSTTQRMINNADAVIAVSNAAKEALLKDGIIGDGKIKVVYNGIDDKFFEPKTDDAIRLRGEFGFDAGDFIIGNVGHMGCKGQEELVLALKDVCAQYPKVKCLFVSEMPHNVGNFVKFVEDSGLSERVVLKGYRKDMPAVMRMIDLFVIVPKWEAFGLVLVEAMAAAKPIVATDMGGIPEVVKDKVNGLLVPYKDIKALSKAIIYMIENKEKAAEMGRKGYEIARSRFNYEDHIDKIEEIYYQSLL